MEHSADPPNFFKHPFGLDGVEQAEIRGHQHVEFQLVR
jgi:hypothetical protein